MFVGLAILSMLFLLAIAMLSYVPATLCTRDRKFNGYNGQIVLVLKFVCIKSASSA
jgi:hypothetical protein